MPSLLHQLKEQSTNLKSLGTSGEYVVDYNAYQYSFVVHNTMLPQCILLDDEVALQVRMRRTAKSEILL